MFMNQFKFKAAVMVATLMSATAFAESPKWAQEHVRTAATGSAQIYIPNPAPNQQKVAAVVRHYAMFDGAFIMQINRALDCAAVSSEANFNALADRMLESGKPETLAKRLRMFQNQEVRQVSNDFFEIQILLATHVPLSSSQPHPIIACYKEGVNSVR